ncbi:MAG: hypothetical protein S4CHLAM2_18250 [Chlamydiales bacterium]|nr:hypothetical protein [Chlamydiales bacterium]
MNGVFMKIVCMLLMLVPLTLFAQVNQLGYQREAVRNDGKRVYFYGQHPSPSVSGQVRQLENLYLRAPTQQLREQYREGLEKYWNIQVHESSEPAQDTQSGMDIYGKRVDFEETRPLRQDEREHIQQLKKAYLNERSEETKGVIRNKLEREYGVQVIEQAPSSLMRVPRQRGQRRSSQTRNQYGIGIERAP